jgi:hypothetical protein
VATCGAWLELDAVAVRLARARVDSSLIGDQRVEEDVLSSVVV